MKDKIPGILDDLRPLRPAEIGRLDLAALAFTGRIINDAKVTDHHAIIPTGKVPGELSPAARKVFDAVLTRLIAAFYPTCVKEVTTVSSLSNGVPFRAKGRAGDRTRVDRPLPAQGRRGEGRRAGIPEFRPGESGPHEPSVKRGETTPPKPYTEGSLLGAMETAGKLVDDEQLKEALKERGLGTPATRAAIIETLLERGYIARQGKALAATDLGRYLVAIGARPGPQEPGADRRVGGPAARDRAGRLDPRRFMEDIVRYAGEVIRSGDPPPVDPTRLGDCPRCGRPVIEGKRGFGCSGWRDGCPFILWREFQGRSLSDDQIRELLQRGVLLAPSVFGRRPVDRPLPDGVRRGGGGAGPGR